MPAAKEGGEADEKGAFEEGAFSFPVFEAYCSLSPPSAARNRR
jgi:hypothetical protein